MNSFEPRVLESSGKTLDEAIYNGLQQMGIAIDEVDIETVQQATKGVFGIGSKPHIVRLTERDPRLLMMDDEPAPKPRRERERAPRKEARPPREQQGEATRGGAPSGEATSGAAAQSEPRRERPDADHRDGERRDGDHRDGERSGNRSRSRGGRGRNRRSGGGQAKGEAPLAPAIPYEEYVKGESQSPAADFLSGLLDKMDVAASLYVAEDEGVHKVKIISESMGILIGHRGETLDAMQYVTGLVINRGKQDYQRVSIDTENYRSKREETLTRLARKIASQVRQSGKSVTLEPMNPYERRVLHASLQSNPHVTTHSVGEEPNRCVVVSPKES